MMGATLTFLKKTADPHLSPLIDKRVTSLWGPAAVLASSLAVRLGYCGLCFPNAMCPLYVGGLGTETGRFDSILPKTFGNFVGGAVKQLKRAGSLVSQRAVEMVCHTSAAHTSN